MRWRSATQRKAEHELEVDRRKVLRCRLLFNSRAMAFALRRSIKSIAENARNAGKRSIAMSARLRAEEAIEEMKKTNPYFEKYAIKLATLQQSSPEEFLAKLESVQKPKPPQKKEETPRYGREPSIASLI